MKRAVFVALLACDAGERVPPAPPPPPPPAPRCEAVSTATQYTVCVVDDDGRPVRGAKVTAVQTMSAQTLGHGGVMQYEVGTVVTDELGRAAFAMKERRTGFLWSGREISREATIELPSR